MSANVWPLLRFGRDDRALLSLRDAYEREPNPSHIMELGVAYLWASDYGARVRALCQS